MSTTAALDEYNELFRDKDRDERHPEDRNAASDHSESESDHAEDYREIIDTDDELEIPRDMRSNYYMPSIRSEANTGPKGVIADAQAYEQAKKERKRFTWKKNGAPSQFDDERSSDEDLEDSFLKQWREERLQELRTAGQRIRSRTTSPTRRIYGTLPDADAELYLNAIENTPATTTVVVFIVDDTVDSSEDEADAKLKDDLPSAESIAHYMVEVAKRNETVRFIRISNDLAAMEKIGVPAAVAYKGGKKIADVVALRRVLKDTVVSAISLETCLRQHRVL